MIPHHSTNTQIEIDKMKVTLQEHTNPLNLGKYAAICYGREGNDEKRLKHIISVGHLSVLRFGMAVFKIEGISRVCSHQIVRHKHLDYLQRSSRYCDESECEFVWPESILNSKDIGAKESRQLWLEGYKYVIEECGISKQDARYFLPQAQATELYIVGNWQAWLDFVNLRTTKATQTELRNVALEIQRQLAEIAPEIFK